MIDILDDLQKYVPTLQTVEQVVVPHHSEQIKVSKNQFFNIAFLYMKMYVYMYVYV